MPDEINLRLPREFANELLEDLDVLIERWEATEELLLSDYCRDDVLTFLCETPEEAQGNVTRYQAIRETVAQQLRK